MLRGRALAEELLGFVGRGLWADHVVDSLHEMSEGDLLARGTSLAIEHFLLFILQINYLNLS